MRTRLLDCFLAKPVCVFMVICFSEAVIKNKTKTEHFHSTSSNFAPNVSNGLVKIKDWLMVISCNKSIP